MATVSKNVAKVYSSSSVFHIDDRAIQKIAVVQNAFQPNEPSEGRVQPTSRVSTIDLGLTQTDWLLRQVFASAIGAILGLDREVRRRRVGTRIYMMVSPGSAVFIIAAVEMSRVRLFRATRELVEWRQPRACGLPVLDLVFEVSSFPNGRAPGTYSKRIGIIDVSVHHSAVDLFSDSNRFKERLRNFGPATNFACANTSLTESCAGLFSARSRPTSSESASATA